MKSPEEYPRLLVTAEPFPDESLKGLLLRVCELNGYKHVQWLKKLAGYENYHTPPQGDAIKRLSILTGIQYTRLQSFAYNVEKSVQTRKKDPARCCYFGNVLIKRHWIEQVAARVCPRCLSDSPYARAIWDMKFITACPTHGISLLDRCPRCGQLLRWTRKSITFCGCGFDLRHAKPRTASGPEIELNTCIYSAVAMHDAIVASNYGIPVDALALLELPELFDFIIFIGRIFHTGTAPACVGQGLLALSNAQQLALTAADCLESWPHKFQERLRRILGPHRDISGLNVALELKAIYPYMRVFAQKPHFDFVRQLVSDFLHQRWDGGPARSSTIMRTLSREHTRYITGNDAKRLLKCNPQTVVRLLEDGTLDGKTVDRGRSRVNLFTRKSVENLAALLSESINTEAATEMLGVTPRTLYLLERARLFRNRANPIRRHIRLYARRDIESLLSLMNDAANCGKQKSLYSPVTFAGVLRRTRVPIAYLLRYIQEGVIRPIDVNYSRSGLYKYIFDLREVQALKNRFRRLGI